MRANTNLAHAAGGMRQADSKHQATHQFHALPLKPCINRTAVCDPAGPTCRRRQQPQHFFPFFLFIMTWQAIAVTGHHQRAVIYTSSYSPVSLKVTATLYVLRSNTACTDDIPPCSAGRYRPRKPSASLGLQETVEAGCLSEALVAPRTRAATGLPPLVPLHTLPSTACFTDHLFVTLIGS